MRIIAGQFRSRVLIAPPGQGTRPTSDRLRETLFNVLGERVRDCQFADLYAGSGAVGMEALSRGAAHCLLAERAPAAIAALRRNVAALHVAGLCLLETRSVARALAEAGRLGRTFDIVFLDPPYEAAAEYAATLSRLGELTPPLLREGAVVVAEHARRTALAEVHGVLRRTRLLEQGDAALSLYAIGDVAASMA